MSTGDWPFIGGVCAAITLIGPALVFVPAWRVMILGSTAGTILLLLGVERARARRRMQRLATQLKSVASLEKLEVPDDPSASALDRALNDAIQRSREQARILKFTPQAVPSSAALGMLADSEGTPRSVAVLALGLRDQEQPGASPEAMEQLREIAGTVVRVAEEHSALLQMQGSGTFALIFAAFFHEPAARSASAAYDAAVELITAHSALRCGISVGAGLPCTLPGAGYTVLGSPFEEAVRLHRLSASWDEFQVLCPEPVALLLRPRAAGQRTHLQLTAANAPTLPVYSLEIVEATLVREVSA
jgi:hypothetical protein